MWCILTTASTKLYKCRKNVDKERSRLFRPPYKLNYESPKPTLIPQKLGHYGLRTVQVQLQGYLLAYYQLGGGSGPSQFPPGSPHFWSVGSEKNDWLFKPQGSARYPLSKVKNEQNKIICIYYISNSKIKAQVLLNIQIS